MHIGRLVSLLCFSAVLFPAAFGQSNSSQAGAAPPRTEAGVRAVIPVIDLYEGAIPNSKAVADKEHQREPGILEDVSHPTIAVYLPPPSRTSRSAVVIFPGGGYVMEVYEREGTRLAEEFQDRGIAAFVVKYRLPSDATMLDKTIGPLQDAQQALRVVRRNAARWNLDPDKVGVMGFSAGGHLASTVGTHFDKAYIPNPDIMNLRPDFLILVYPVISLQTELAHPGSRTSLLGADPTAGQVHLFSNDEQVTEKTPPAILLHAGDDTVVDVDNSVRFYEAMRHHNVPAEMILFPIGGHGFPQLAFDQWFRPILEWMVKNGWQRP